MLPAVSENDEPISYEEAANSTYKGECHIAMNEEYDALMKNQTRELCTLSEDRKLIDCKWVYKIKSKQEEQFIGLTQG